VDGIGKEESVEGEIRKRGGRLVHSREKDIFNNPFSNRMIEIANLDQEGIFSTQKNTKKHQKSTDLQNPQMFAGNIH
jgi:hypothetical protein